MEIIRFSDCVPLPAGFYHCPWREQDFFISMLEIIGIAHYDAETWIEAMNYHPVGALLHGLLPENGYMIDDGAGHHHIFANSLGLRHIYSCHLLLVALDDLEFYDAAPAG
jgi:hypothetical protein